MDIIHARDADEAARKAGERLSQSLAGREEKPTLLLLSGGSSFRLLEAVDADAPEPHLTIAMLDDRASADPGVNTFAQFAATDFYAAAHARGAAFFDTRLVPGEGVRELAERYNNALLSWIADNSHGTVIAIIGFGPDGHTAGIMPFPEDPQKFAALFENSSRWAVGYDAGAKSRYPLRVTVNLPFLREKVDEAIAYATGDGKRAALARVLAEDGALAETPARILREMKKVVLYTDIPL